MKLEPPAFIQDLDSGVDAVAEFTEMMSDVGEQAAHFLAELSELQNFKTFGDVPYQDKSGTPGLLIRYLGDWAIFYVAVEKPFVVLVVHAARYKGNMGSNPSLFRSASDEAVERVHLLSQETKR